MDREEYNTCMKPYMQGQKTKQQRQFDMCIGAKICTGKAPNKEEAEKICNQPKLPKWAKQALPEDMAKADLTCPEKIKRTLDHLDLIVLKINEGEAAEARPLAALVISDTISCRPEMVKGMIDEAMEQVNDLSKRHYLKGESKEVQSQIKVIREVLST